METTEFREPHASQVMLAKIGGPILKGNDLAQRENAVSAAASRCRMLDAQLARTGRELMQMKKLADFLERHEKEIEKDPELEQTLYNLLTGIRP